MALPVEQSAPARDRRLEVAVAHWAPRFVANGVRVEIPFAGHLLAAILRKPGGAARPPLVAEAARPPLVVMAMGLDSAKEEMDAYERDFLARRMAAEVSGPVELLIVPGGNHVANNRPYLYRPQSADWMARQLGAAQG